MQFTVPKSFNLGGQKIKIVELPIVANDTTCDGMACYNKQKIELLKGMEPEYKEFVFFHELVHHILNQMSETELRGNEKFVNQFATFLHQSIKTMR